MDKDFLAIRHRDEAVTFFGAEPLDNSGYHFPRQPPAKPNVHLNLSAAAPQVRNTDHDRQARGAYIRFLDCLQEASPPFSVHCGLTWSIADASPVQELSMDSYESSDKSKHE